MNTGSYWTQVFELSNLISVGGALVAALPASVALDEALDSVQQRVQAITNLDANGTRCFIAYPDAYRAEECRKWPVVLVIHQILGVQPRVGKMRCNRLRVMGR